MAEGDVAGAERWTRMELSFWEAVKTFLSPETPADTLAEWQRNTAAALMNLSVVHRAQERFADARAALARAIELAMASEHRGLQAQVYRHAATLAWQTGEDRDEVIELWRNAISAAVEDGGARQVADSSIELAEVLVRLGEYDLAWNEVERASTQLPFAVDPDAGKRIEIVRAAVNARRGSASSATAAAGPQRDAIAHNLNLLRQGTSQPLAEVLSSPEVDQPLPPQDAQIWDAALGQNNLGDALLVLLGR